MLIVADDGLTGRATQVGNSFTHTDASEVPPDNDQQSFIGWTESKAQLEA